MIHQDSHKFTNSTLMSWLFAEEADNEVLVVFCMEHYKLVLAVGDAQTSQLHRDTLWKTVRLVLRRIHLKIHFVTEQQIVFSVTMMTFIFTKFHGTSRWKEMKGKN